jgi:hypothetical protein
LLKQAKNYGEFPAGWQRAFLRVAISQLLYPAS